MDIQVKIIRENEDGSADAELFLDKDAVALLIGEGFLSIIKHWIDQNKPNGN